MKPAEVKSTTAPPAAAAAARPFDLPSTPSAAGPVKVLEARCVVLLHHGLTSYRSKSKRKAPEAVGAVPAATESEPAAKVPCREAPAVKEAPVDKFASRCVAVSGVG